MEFPELVRRSRSYRRFEESRRISGETLQELVELTRFAPSGSNRQPIRYVVVSDQSQCEMVFPSLAWAGYLDSWKGPEAGERPTAYIIVLVDTEITNSAATDVGIASQTIMLGAAERGIGGCMLGAIKREQIREALSIPGTFEIPLVLALGYPNETIVIDDIGDSESIKYYRDSNDVHHVPKRTLEQLIVSFD